MCTEIFTYLAHQENYPNHKIILSVFGFLPFFLLNYKYEAKIYFFSSIFLSLITDKIENISHGKEVFEPQDRGKFSL